MSKVPFLPRTKRRLFYGGLLSLAVGIIVALIRNQLDTKFHEPEDIAKYTNLPSLGYVPFLLNLMKMMMLKVNIKISFQ